MHRCKGNGKTCRHTFHSGAERVNGWKRVSISKWVSSGRYRHLRFALFNMAFGSVKHAHKKVELLCASMSA